jgi:nucleotide-binding universal stress UspA family protein
MKVLAAIAGPISAKKKTNYNIRIAKRLGAELIALHVLKNEKLTKRGEIALSFLSKACQKAKVKVKTVLKKTDVVTAIIQTAKEEKVDLIIMGADKKKVVSEWLSADVMKKTKIPAVVIPHEFKKV